MAGVNLPTITKIQQRISCNDWLFLTAHYHNEIVTGHLVSGQSTTSVFASA